MLLYLLGWDMLGKAQYEVLSEFRCRLAGFLHFSEMAAREAGLTPAQYMLLLHLRGFPGRDWATIGELAQRLHTTHQGAAALVQRCEQHGLVVKLQGREDARRVEVRITRRAEKLVERVAAHHVAELAQLGEVFTAAAAVGPIPVPESSSLFHPANPDP